MVKIYIPKWFKLRKIEVRGNIPPRYTTFKLYLKKRNIPIPFPKTKIVKGIGYKSEGSGRDNKGEYYPFKNKSIKA